jgi:PadR family transcriptional regulator PadR
MDDRFLYAGLTRLHVLHHAKKPVYGLAMIEELGRHGYKASAGALYPILHRLEKRRYLTSTEERTGRAARRIHRATAAGTRALAVKLKVCELFGELFEGAVVTPCQATSGTGPSYCLIGECYRRLPCRRRSGLSPKSIGGTRVKRSDP